MATKFLTKDPMPKHSSWSMHSLSTMACHHAMHTRADSQLAFPIWRTSISQRRKQLWRMRTKTQRSWHLSHHSGHGYGQNQQSHYQPGQLIDYHRPTYDKDSHGGWTGPFPVIRNEPDKGQVICRSGGREIRVRYPDALLSLFMECLLLAMQDKHEAMDIVLDYISRLPSGKSPVTFGYTSDKQSKQFLTTASKNAPKVFLALQHVTSHILRILNVVAVIMGKAVHKLSMVPYATGCTLVYYESDNSPVFHYYETKDSSQCP